MALIDIWRQTHKKESLEFFQDEQFRQDYTNQMLLNRFCSVHRLIETSLESAILASHRDTYNILSLGCGPGSDLLAVIQVFQTVALKYPILGIKSIHCEGVDLFHWPLTVFNERLQQILCPVRVDAKFFQSDMEVFVRRSNEVFDFIILCYADVRSRVPFVGDLLPRCLREGGKIFVIDNASDALNTLEVAYGFRCISKSCATSTVFMTCESKTASNKLESTLTYWQAGEMIPYDCSYARAEMMRRLQSCEFEMAVLRTRIYEAETSEQIHRNLAATYAQWLRESHSREILLASQVQELAAVKEQLQFRGAEVVDLQTRLIEAREATRWWQDASMIKAKELQDQRQMEALVQQELVELKKCLQSRDTEVEALKTRLTEAEATERRHSEAAEANKQQMMERQAKTEELADQIAQLKSEVALKDSRTVAMKLEIHTLKEQLDSLITRENRLRSDVATCTKKLQEKWLENKSQAGKLTSQIRNANQLRTALRETKARLVAMEMKFQQRLNEATELREREK